MNRSSRSLIKYAIAFFVMIFGAALTYAIAGSLFAVLIYAFVLLLPGRVGGFYLRNLFLSRSLLNRARPAEAIDAGQRFLNELERQPWRRFFIYCFWGFYTWNVEAMALNNIGAAHLELGNLDQSEDYLRRAIVRDAGYAIPYVNLAVISYTRGNKAEGDRLISIAKGYGYTGTVRDRVVAKVAGTYADAQSVRNI